MCASVGSVRESLDAACAIECIGMELPEARFAVATVIVARAVGSVVVVVDSRGPGVVDMVRGAQVVAGVSAPGS